MTVPRAMMATMPSTSIPPYPIFLASDSHLICLAVVPDATMEWKPLQAPQATVMNRIGKSGPRWATSVKAGYVGSTSAGQVTSIPPESVPTTIPRPPPNTVM